MMSRWPAASRLAFVISLEPTPAMKDVFSFEPRLAEFLQSTTPESVRDKTFLASVRNFLELCWKEWPAAEYGQLPPKTVTELGLEARDKKDAKKEQEVAPDMKALWTTPYKLWEHAIHAHLLTHLVSNNQSRRPITTLTRT
jgi:hypothetical protein